MGRNASVDRSATNAPRDDAVVYVDKSSIPRDLRTAEQLATGGYAAHGPVVAWLKVPAGPMHLAEGEAENSTRPAFELLALHSTSEARRLMGFRWTWPARTDRAPQPTDGHPAPPRGPRTPRGRVVGSHTPLLPRRSRRAGIGRDPRRWLSDLFHEGFVVIDTETTGLSARDEVIELSAVDASGEVLYETLIRPRSGFVPASSTRIHGLHFTDVEHGPTWPEAIDGLLEAVAGKRVVAWNAPFDMRLCVQSSRAWGIAHPLPGFECAMRAYTACRGISSGAFRLERAASVEGVLVAPQSHRSADDARLTVAVLRRLFEQPTPA